MITSENITALTAALSKAQAHMTGAKKSAKNPFFKSNYSDLSSVIEAISQPFADNGLSFAQSPGFTDGMVTVTTRIMHESGEWIEGVTALPPTKNDAQGYGSAITYGRRYGLQAMAGVPSVDDDGQGAVKHKAEQPVLEADYISKTIAEAKDMKTLTDLWAKLTPTQHAAFSDMFAQVKGEILK